MAMSYGRPVVVSDLPGMLEMVIDGWNGYTFEQGSKDALAERLIEVLPDESGRDRVAAQASQYIHERHDWEQIGKSTAEIYRSILAAH
jgi:glycosyltransferase involved in cell wall biosynthesis